MKRALCPYLSINHNTLFYTRRANNQLLTEFLVKNFVAYDTVPGPTIRGFANVEKILISTFHTKSAFDERAAQVFIIHNRKSTNLKFMLLSNASCAKFAGTPTQTTVLIAGKTSITCSKKSFISRCHNSRSRRFVLSPSLQKRDQMMGKIIYIYITVSLLVDFDRMCGFYFCYLVLSNVHPRQENYAILVRTARILIIVCPSPFHLQNLP